MNHVYGGVGWRKKHKAPTDFGFCIKHPKLQSKSSKFIKYLCADDERTLHRWMVGIRIAKSGRKLLDNYRALVEELAQVSHSLPQSLGIESYSGRIPCGFHTDSMRIPCGFHADLMRIRQGFHSGRIVVG